MDTRPPLARNPVSVAGAWLTTLAAFAFITFYVLEAFGLVDSPYAGLIGFVTLPAVFIAGLLLIPLGMWRERRRRTAGRAPWAWPAVDLRESRTRAVVLTVGALTLVNLAIVLVATVGAVHYMETDTFCGQVCHTPMTPEFTAHQVAPHANVGCVSCHVGPGAAGTVRAKLNGARQLYEFLTNSYHRPIPTPVRNMPAASDTCVRCHAPGRRDHDVSYVTHEYSDDEENSDTPTSIVMFTAAAHWHARPDVTVEFAATDATHATIPYVRVTEPGGVVTEYQSTEHTDRPEGPLHRMDCLDCHNRPAHTMSESAERAVDRAITAGRISRELPYIRREAVAALTEEYPDAGTAGAGIRKKLTAFYATQPTPPAPAVLDTAVAAVTDLYRTNVFPGMKVTWGTYSSQLAHPEGAGCFRCHDDEHKTASAEKAIRQDCELCHKVD